MATQAPNLNGRAPAALKTIRSNSNCGGLTSSDALIDAIAEAVALKLERIAGMQQRLMDLHDGARYLGMTENAIREKVAGAEIPCVRIDSKLRFDRQELDRWIDKAPRQGV